MRVLQALLAKAYCAAAIFLCVMANQDRNMWFFLMTILLILYQTSFIDLTFTYFQVRFARKIMPVLFLCLQISWLRVTLCEQKSLEMLLKSVNCNELSQFVNDNALPFFQYRQTLTYINIEITSVLIFIFRYLCMTKIGPIMCAEYLLWVFIHGLLVVFVCDNLYVTIYSKVFDISVENFSPLDLNASTLYPEGYIKQEKLNSSLYQLPVRQHIVFTQGPNIDKCTCNWKETTYDDHFTDSKGNDLPYSYVKIHRYIGEDVKLSCAFSRGGTVGNTRYRETYWTLNDRRISMSSRIFFNTVYGAVDQETNFTSVSSELNVFFLQKSDFGEFRCITAFPFEGQLYAFETKYLIAVYEVEEVQEKVIVVHRSVGSLFIPNYFLYYTFADLYDITAEYTVNEKSIDTVCAGLTGSSCSVGAMFLLGFDLVGTGNFPIVKVEESTPGLLRLFVLYCMCSKGYGVHRVTFIRKVVKNGKANWEDVKHPIVFIVLPKTDISLFRRFDDTELYKDIANMVTYETDLTVIQNKFLELDSYVDANEYKVLFFANIIQFSIIFLTSMVAAALILLISTYYCKIFIQPAALTFFSRLLLPASNVVYMEPTLFHDVFISHSGAEYEFVRDKLLPFLEEQCSLKVCFPERDIEKGKPEIGLYVNHITNSRKVIVILSGEYQKDSMCSKLQLDSIILPMLYENRRTKVDVLFIKYDSGACFPKPLRWNFDVETLDWRTHLTLKNKLLSVKKWLATGKV